MKASLLRPLVCGILVAMTSGCAMTPEKRNQTRLRDVAQTPFEQLPAVYDTWVRKRVATPSQRDALMKAWLASKEHREKVAEEDRKRYAAEAEARQRWWASLTPGQRYDYELRERQLQQQEELTRLQMAQQQELIRMNAAIARQQYVPQQSQSHPVPDYAGQLLNAGSQYNYNATSPQPQQRTRYLVTPDRVGAPLRQGAVITPLD